MNGNNNMQLKLIMQSLLAAETSIGLAKQLLSAYGGIPVGGGQVSPNPRFQPRPDRDNRPSTRDLPGIIGKYDGENMISGDGKSFPVPGNYAGKSKLVYGDTLKLMDTPEGGKLFKQIEKVNRKRLEAKLAKKDGKWVVVTESGATYKTLGTNVEFLGGKEGDLVAVLIPDDNPKSPYAAIDVIQGRDVGTRPSYKVLVPTSAIRPAEAPKPETKPEPKPEPKASAGVEATKEEKPAVKRGGRKPSGRVEKEPENEEPKVPAKKEKVEKAEEKPAKDSAADDDELR
ncbi:MAG: hypothetical protein AAB486_01045 [Patescibacteria group bacterium]